MKLDNVGEVIATRRLFLDGEVAGSTDILVKLGKPQPFPDFADFYYCPYQITGLGDEKVRFASGIDGFQAIDPTFRAIGIDLYLGLNPEVGSRLRWEGDEHGDLGFPRSPEAGPDPDDSTGT